MLNELSMMRWRVPPSVAQIAQANHVVVDVAVALDMHGRTPSMMLAWFRASEIMASCSLNSELEPRPLASSGGVNGIQKLRPAWLPALVWELEAHRAQAVAVQIDNHWRPGTSRDGLRPKWIIGAEVQHFASFVGLISAPRAGNDALLLEKAGVFDFLSC
jgi:hypothetical protein